MDTNLRHIDNEIVSFDVNVIVLLGPIGSTAILSVAPVASSFFKVYKRSLAKTSFLDRVQPSVLFLLRPIICESAISYNMSITRLSSLAV